jgi:hypothetical protein
MKKMESGDIERFEESSALRHLLFALWVAYFNIFLGPMFALTIKSIYKAAVLCFPKKPNTLVDSNPDHLFHGRMRGPLRQVLSVALSMS